MEAILQHGRSLGLGTQLPEYQNPRMLKALNTKWAGLNLTQTHPSVYFRMFNLQIRCVTVQGEKEKIERRMYQEEFILLKRVK